MGNDKTLRQARGRKRLADIFQKLLGGGPGPGLAQMKAVLLPNRGPSHGAHIQRYDRRITSNDARNNPKILKHEGHFSSLLFEQVNSRTVDRSGTEHSFEIG
jgi:hypothetical protein